VYGGAAMSYGRLTSGKIEVTLDAELKIHDYAPFVPIIECAGAVITD
jgi:inositol-phosphate phosphatase / L-galactose 1-phosphate phosphatase / histidinol-phosphatase